jgi:hypothetical protein
MDDLRRIYDVLMPRLHASAVLAKHADADALLKKAGTDLATLRLLKYASGPFAKGLMYGAGAAIPAGLIGAGLISHAGNESRKTVEDIRNKALQAALGVAGIGGGLYALHRATGDQKHAAAHEPPYDLLEKLATVGFLDVVFEDQHKNGQDETTRNKAAECLLLNAEHGADILQQLLD